MIPQLEIASANELPDLIRKHVKLEGEGLGLITSVDGDEVVVLLLCPRENKSLLVAAEIPDGSYPSFSPWLPQAHWFERALMDLFGIVPRGHPRLKSIYAEPAFKGHPLRKQGATLAGKERDFDFLRVSGQGVYELPVGPVHAGIIEPGHFRLSCLGEKIQNLEIRLGYLHRGVEKRLTEVPWENARFVAEAATSDTAAANALAHAVAIESILETEVPLRAQYLRSMALEIERIAMHIADIGGMAVDLGYLGVAATLSRLRTEPLKLAELLSGSRFMRGFICPGGIVSNPCQSNLMHMRKAATDLHEELSLVLSSFLDNASVYERLSGIGFISKALAEDFGLVGVAARASDIACDTRQVFAQGLFPATPLPLTTATTGDALARIQVRAGELTVSLGLLEDWLSNFAEGPYKCELPGALPQDKTGVGVVEAFRGELIHLVMTDNQGKIKRYAIKDPSINNWTGMAIAARNELIADFPVCNKSFGLSYSGHDC